MYEYLKTSCISHPPQTYYVVLRDEYLHITNHNACAALLLSIFEDMTNTFGDDWTPQSSKSIKAQMLGMYSAKVILETIEQLVKDGFVLRRRNPTNLFDKVYQYKLNVPYVQSKLDAYSANKD